MYTTHTHNTHFALPTSWNISVRTTSNKNIRVHTCLVTERISDIRTWYNTNLCNTHTHVRAWGDDRFWRFIFRSCTRARGSPSRAPGTSWSCKRPVTNPQHNIVYRVYNKIFTIIVLLLFKVVRRGRRDRGAPSSARQFVVVVANRVVVGRQCSHDGS